jgi:hypothetical protein
MAEQIVCGIPLVFNDKGFVYKGIQYAKAWHGIDYNETFYCAFDDGDNVFITINFNSEDGAMNCADEINRHINLAKNN